MEMRVGVECLVRVEEAVGVCGSLPLEGPQIFSSLVCCLAFWFIRSLSSLILLYIFVTDIVSYI
jgi:hypothetical protein